MNGRKKKIIRDVSQIGCGGGSDYGDPHKNGCFLVVFAAQHFNVEKCFSHFVWKK